MKASLHHIKFKHEYLAGCNIGNSLHEANGKSDENLKSMKSQPRFYHTTH